MDGILIIDKPDGFTSHDVVARCRRILRTKRVGHTGTLDPFATGVVVVLVGKATRLAQFLDKDAKSYEALVRLGYETDTGDRTGEIRSEEIVDSSEETGDEFQIPDSGFQIGNPEIRKPKSLSEVSESDIEAVLGDFRGEIWQTPPMYSAKKVAGKKLYELARKGVEIERAAVRITNYELRITNFGMPQESDAGIRILDFGLFVRCSAGTYIRTLAEDIGRKLETGAHLAELRRTAAGKFKIEQAVTLENLEKLANEDRLGEILVSMRDAVGHLPEIVLSEKELEYVTTGRKISASENYAGVQNIRLTDADGRLAAIGEIDQDSIKPRIVF